MPNFAELTSMLFLQGLDLTGLTAQITFPAY